MRRRYVPARLLIVPCLLALVASTSWASRSIQILPEPQSLQNETGSPGVLATCTVGETGLGNGGVLDSNPGQSFYTLLEPASCSACPSGVLILRTANFRIRELVFVPPNMAFPCNLPFSVEVSIVGTKTGSTCTLEPDSNLVLCGPVAATITPPGTTSFNASVALPVSCCISRPAFLRIRLVQTSCDMSWGFTFACTPCRSFWANPSSFPGTEEACAFVGSNWRQWVDADCCDPTPSRQGTWGRLKTLYR